MSGKCTFKEWDEIGWKCTEYQQQGERWIQMSEDRCQAPPIHSNKTSGKN